MGDLFSDLALNMDALYYLLHILGGVLILLILKWLFPLLGTGKKSIDISTRWGTELKPTVGGILFLIAVCFFYLFSGLHQRGMSTQLNGLLLGSLIVFSVGLWDDIARISPGRKLAGQLIAAVVFVSFDNSMHIFLDLANSLSVVAWIVDLAFTVFLVVAMMNSVNMMDNMDAVAGIAVFPAMLILGTFSIQDSAHPFDFLTASIIAFLILNWNPSRVFMGDSGSMVLGLVVAFAMISISPMDPENKVDSWIDQIVSVFMLGTVLIADTMLVVFQRIRHGVSPMQGGRDHTSHNLFYSGLSQREIGVLLLFLSFIPMIIQSITVKCLGEANYLESTFWRIAPLAVYFILYLTVMIAISNRNLRTGKYTYSK